jgi:hypothetical protein
LRPGPQGAQYLHGLLGVAALGQPIGQHGRQPAAGVGAGA